MLESPKRKTASIQCLRYCECRPICKNKRRVWKGRVQKTSAELRLQGRLDNEGFQKHSFKGRNGRYRDRSTLVDEGGYGVTICDNPIASAAPTPCLEFAEIAKSLGAWDSVRAKCAFCQCRGCCQCVKGAYQLGAESTEQRRRSMREFDRRVKADYKPMRIMYN